jgi:DNA-binding NarL/FixJ family response regulator
LLAFRRPAHDHKGSGIAMTIQRPPDTGISVAVIDEKAVVRSGIPAILGQAADVHHVHCFTDVTTITEMSQFDVVVLGIHSGEGIGLLRLTDHLSRSSRLVLVSSSLMLAATLVLLDAGADGYLTTDAGEHILREAVLNAARGQPYLDRAVADVLRRTAHLATPCGLASREAELLRHLGDGLTHAQAARRMGVSTGTVETYARRIRAKFPVSGPVQLARLAHQARLQQMLS